jgi:hypothetical protein
VTSTSARIEALSTELALRRARTEIGRETKEGLVAGTERILPGVKSAAPDVVAPYLTAGATTTKAYISTRGPKVYDRIAGLLEYGGTVTTPLFPNEKQAVGPGQGEWVVAEVRTPRKYTGQRRIAAAVTGGLPIAAAVAEREVMASLRRMGL